MKDKTLFELASRLNEIEQEKYKLDLEYNNIVYELWERIPTLKNDETIQPKKKARLKNE
jgi:hypothetical protein